VEVRLVVDTGATAVHLMPDVFARLPEPPPTYDRTVWTPNGEHLTQAGVLEDLSVGETTFSDVDFTTSDLEAISELRAAGVDVDGLLGNSVLLRGVSTLYGWQGDLVIQPYPADVQAELMETLRGG
jgi:predicted aspartyl protease